MFTDAFNQLPKFPCSKFLLFFNRRSMYTQSAKSRIGFDLKILTTNNYLSRISSLPHMLEENWLFDSEIYLPGSTFCFVRNFNSHFLPIHDIHIQLCCRIMIGANSTITISVNAWPIALWGAQLLFQDRLQSLHRWKNATDTSLKEISWKTPWLRR